MLEKFERYPLTFGPTHIEKLERLSQHLGGNVELYAKREDCNSGLAFGGNKLRKLEYIIPDAIASNADTLVSIGGVQSNHTRMVAAVAAKIGMKCRLVQESWVPHEDAVYDRVGNILLSRIMGAQIEMVDEDFDIGIRQSWEDAIADVKAKGGKPYAIPAVASSRLLANAMLKPHRPFRFAHPMIQLAGCCRRGHNGVLRAAPQLSCATCASCRVFATAPPPCGS